MLAYIIKIATMASTNLAQLVEAIRHASNYCGHDEPVSPVPTGRRWGGLPGMLWIGGIVLLARRRAGGSAGIRRVGSWRCATTCSCQRNVDFFLGEVLASKERDAVLNGG
jgi:hypothetical protein